METRKYSSTSPADAEFGTGPGASYASTASTYTLDGKRATLTGPDGARWTYTYDLFGRQVSSDDPDKGTTTTVFDKLDRPTKVTDARGRTVVTAYDSLGRVTETWSESKAEENLLTARTYDSVLKGQPATSTRYVGGKNGRAYTKSVTQYDDLSRPVETQLELPADDPFVQAGIPSTLTFSSDYRVDGTLGNTLEPAMGGLPTEVVGYDYNELGQVVGLGGATGYLLDASYTPRGLLQQLTLGTASVTGHKRVYVTHTYEEGTQRLLRSHVTDMTHGYMLQDLNYAYDEAGNVTSITDPTTLGGRSAADTQCFAYDGQRRLTDAWTPSSGACTTAPTADALGGPAPYWSSYTYNDAGLRTSETRHTSAGGTKTTYCYGDEQPHALLGTSTSGDCASPDRQYRYDASGNTINRPGPVGNQELIWTAEGRLSQLIEGDIATGYLYDADGRLLIRDTEGGERVLYAGATEVHLRDDGTTWARRYYGHDDLTVAVRDNQGGDQRLSYLVGDRYGTSTLAVDAGDEQTYAKRYMAPFGRERGQGAVGTWVDDKGFLGKTFDTGTGLTHVGARQYDVEIGRFISVDPLLEVEKPQTVNGYVYARNNPLAFSDPTGTRAPECGTLYSDCVGGHLTVNTTEYTSRATQTRYYQTNPGTQTWKRSAIKKRIDKNVSYKPGINWDSVHTALEWIGQVPGLGAPADVTNAGIYASHGDWSNAGMSMLSVFKADEIAAGLKWLQKLRKGCRSHSFVPGTDVLLADGTTKNIEDVEVGDKVVTTDPNTGETTIREVKATITTEDDKHFVDLTVTSEDGEAASIVATTSHPFWSPSENRWVDAGDLEPGKTLRTPDGDTVTVTDIRHHTKRQRTHDLTITDIHSYYVLAGETPVLVHNSNCNVADSRRLQAQLTAEELAGADGHAFRKHVVEQGEFPGIRTRAEFASMIEDVVLNGERRVGGGGRSAYWRNGVIVIRNPKARDGGTVFAPKEGYEYFRRNFRPE